MPVISSRRPGMHFLLWLLISLWCDSRLAKAFNIDAAADVLVFMSSGQD